MIVKRQRYYTRASDQAKKNLIDFLTEKSLDHSKLDSKELETFREGLDTIGNQTFDRDNKKLPENFDGVLMKMGVSESVVSQIPHWYHQQSPEIQERYDRILKIRGRKPLTNAEDYSKPTASTHLKTNARILEDLYNGRPKSTRKELEEQKRKFEVLGLPGDITFDPSKPSQSSRRDTTININPTNSDSSTLIHEEGHKVDHHILKTEKPEWSTDGTENGQVTWGRLNRLGNEVAANFYGRDLSKKLGYNEADLKDFDKKRDVPLKTYQLVLLDPDKEVTGSYPMGIGTWLFDNDKEKRKRN